MMKISYALTFIPTPSLDSSFSQATSALCSSFEVVEGCAGGGADTLAFLTAAAQFLYPPNLRSKKDVVGR